MIEEDKLKELKVMKDKEPVKGLVLDSCRDCVKIDEGSDYSCVNCYRNVECSQQGKQFIQVHRCHCCKRIMIRVDRVGVKGMNGEYGWIEWYVCDNVDCKLPFGASRFRRHII